MPHQSQDSLSHDTPSSEVWCPLQIAFDGDGKPTKALQGYCSKNGVQPDQVTREADSKGTEYVWAEKQIPGKPTHEVRAVVHNVSCTSISHTAMIIDDALFVCVGRIPHVTHRAGLHSSA